MPAAPSSQPAMAVGSGAPPVYSKILELGRGRTPDAVPSENVVVRLDELDGGGIVADEDSTPDVLLSSDVVSEIEDEDDTDAEDSGVAEEDATDDDEGVADETEAAEESAALFEGDSTVDERTADLLGAELLGTEGWLGGSCEDSLGEDPGVSLLVSGDALLGNGVSLLDSEAGLGDDMGIEEEDGEGVLLELGVWEEGAVDDALLELGSAVAVADVGTGVT